MEGRSTWRTLETELPGRFRGGKVSVLQALPKQQQKQQQKLGEKTHTKINTCMQGHICKENENKSWMRVEEHYPTTKTCQKRKTPMLNRLHVQFVQ